jgi:hypothetical protein
MVEIIACEIFSPTWTGITGSEETNLNQLTQRQCDRIAEQLNNSPTLRLSFKKANEVYY